MTTKQTPPALFPGIIVPRFMVSYERVQEWVASLTPAQLASLGLRRVAEEAGQVVERVTWCMRCKGRAELAPCSNGNCENGMVYLSGNGWRASAPCASCNGALLTRDDEAGDHCPRCGKEAIACTPETQRWVCENNHVWDEPSHAPQPTPTQAGEAPGGGEVEMCEYCGEPESHHKFEPARGFAPCPEFASPPPTAAPEREAGEKPTLLTATVPRSRAIRCALCREVEADCRCASRLAAPTPEPVIAIGASESLTDMLRARVAESEASEQCLHQELLATGKRAATAEAQLAEVTRERDLWETSNNRWKVRAEAAEAKLEAARRYFNAIANGECWNARETAQYALAAIGPAASPTTGKDGR